MSISVNIVKRTKALNAYYIVADVTLDTSYPTGGEVVSHGELGLTSIDFVLPSPAAGYIFEFDHANNKLKAFYGDYNATEDGALIQVPDKTDMSTVKVRLIAIGI